MNSVTGSNLLLGWDDDLGTLPEWLRERPDSTRGASAAPVAPAGHAGERNPRLARVVADRVAVGAGADLADHGEHAGLQRLGDPHLEGLRLLVHLVPGNAHHLDQERLDQAVAADHVPGDALALGGQRDALARPAADQLGDARRRHLHRPGQVDGAALDARLAEPVEGLQVLLDSWGELGAGPHGAHGTCWKGRGP